MNTNATAFLSNRFRPLLPSMQNAQNGNNLVCYRITDDIRQTCDYQFACAVDATGSADFVLIQQNINLLTDGLDHFSGGQWIVLSNI